MMHDEVVAAIKKPQIHTTDPDAKKALVLLTWYAKKPRALFSVFHKEKMVLLLYYSSSGRITFIGNGLIIQSRGNPSSTSKQEYSWTLTMHNIPEKKTGYGCRYIIGNATK